MPTTEEGIETPTNANAEIADGATAIDETEDEAWLEEEHETLEERYRRYVRRYVQSSRCEVSGPDEWADILMELLAQCVQGQGQGKEATSSDRPTPRAMPKPLAAQRDRRLADEAAEEMVQRAEAESERHGVRQVLPSAGSRSRSIPSGDNENYFQDSLGMASYYGVGLVPREFAAFEEYIWDPIMQDWVLKLF